MIKCLLHNLLSHAESQADSVWDHGWQKEVHSGVPLQLCDVEMQKRSIHDLAKWRCTEYNIHLSYYKYIVQVHFCFGLNVQWWWACNMDLCVIYLPDEHQHSLLLSWFCCLLFWNGPWYTHINLLARFIMLCMKMHWVFFQVLMTFVLVYNGYN